MAFCDNHMCFCSWTVQTLWTAFTALRAHWQRGQWSTRQNQQRVSYHCLNMHMQGRWPVVTSMGNDPNMFCTFLPCGWMSSRSPRGETVNVATQWSDKKNSKRWSMFCSTITATVTTTLHWCLLKRWRFHCINAGGVRSERRRCLSRSWPCHVWDSPSYRLKDTSSHLGSCQRWRNPLAWQTSRWKWKNLPVRIMGAATM